MRLSLGALGLLLWLSSTTGRLTGRCRARPEEGRSSSAAECGWRVAAKVREDGRFTTGGVLMPSGDASRVWFPELIDLLRQEWSASSTWLGRVRLRARLDDMLSRVRTERNARPPMIYCKTCGKRERAAEPRVSVRAMIFAAQRYGCVSEAEMKVLEKEWKKLCAAEGLDLYGEPKHGSNASSSCHT